MPQIQFCEKNHSESVFIRGKSVAIKKDPSNEEGHCVKLPIDLQFCIGKFASGRAASSLAARRTGIVKPKSIMSQGRFL